MFQHVKMNNGKKNNSIFGGLIFGILIFIASFYVLYQNEGSVDISRIASKATEISANNIDPANENELIVLSDRVTSEQTLGDTYLREGEYLVLRRQVEMFAWKEKRETRDDRTTYEYTKEWTSRPEDSTRFEESSIYQNPPLPVPNETFFVSDAKVGAFNIDFSNIQLPQLSSLGLNDQNAILSAFTTENTEYEFTEPEIVQNTIFIGYGSFQDPAIGDFRISYQILPRNAELTIFGMQKDGSIRPYIGTKNTRLFRAFNQTREEAIVTMHQEYKTSLWMFRGLGFFMMWIGLQMFFSPLTRLLNYIPFFGRLGSGLIGIIAFVTALILSAITIIISMILHNIFAIITIVLILGAGVGYFIYQKSQAAPSSKEKAHTPDPKS